MLKKSLIALAIASVAGSVSAADILTPKNYLSIQGATSKTEISLNEAQLKSLKLDKDGKLVASGSVDAKGTLSVQLGAQYKNDDIIELNFTGAKLVDFGTEINATLRHVKEVEDGLAWATPEEIAAEETVTEPVGSMTLGVLSKDDNKVTLRVTSLDYKENVLNDVKLDSKFKTTFGGTLQFNGITLNVADILANGRATVTYSARTAGADSLPLDTAGNNTQVLFEAANQFAARVVTPFNNVVDVNEERKKFTGITGEPKQTTTISTIELKTIDLNSADLNSEVEPEDSKVDKFAYPAPATKSEFTVFGDFAFMGEADDKGLIKEPKGKVTGEAKVYTDKLAFSVANTGEASVELTVPGDVIIPHQSFTATAKVGYSTTSATFDIANAGQWKLNGAVVHVPYMPFRTGFSPIVNISNVSKQDGGIEVIVYQQDNAWVEPQSFTLDTVAKAEAQTNITPELRTLGIEGDVAFDIIVNAPAKDIAVNALYFQGGDRAVINTVDRSTK